MFHVYEFEVFEDEGYYLAFPFDWEGGTQGRDLADVCEMAADWLRVMCEDCAMHDKPFPPQTFGNRPEHGGTILLVGVEAGKNTVRKATPSEAARRLGASPERVRQMMDEGLLESFSDGGQTWVTLDSIEARAAELHPAEGLPGHDLA